MEPAVLFKLANLIAMLGWVAMIILHDRPITYRLIFNGIILLLSLFYASAIAWSFSEPQGQGDFSSLEGVMALFTNPKSVLAGWVHYLAFDMMMGLLMIHVSARHGVNRFVLLPVLFFTFMFGPVGLLILYGLLMYKQNTFFPAIFTSSK
jgi:hypothetical protein